MASILHESKIDPFDSQEAKPYKQDPEIVAMTNLVAAFRNKQIKVCVQGDDSKEGLRLVASSRKNRWVERDKHFKALGTSLSFRR